jgi:hypothetical protein
MVRHAGLPFNGRLSQIPFGRRDYVRIRRLCTA